MNVNTVDDSGVGSLEDDWAFCPRDFIRSRRRRSIPGGGRTALTREGYGPFSDQDAFTNLWLWALFQEPAVMST